MEPLSTSEVRKVLNEFLGVKRAYDNYYVVAKIWEKIRRTDIRLLDKAIAVLYGGSGPVGFYTTFCWWLKSAEEMAEAMARAIQMQKLETGNSEAVSICDYLYRFFHQSTNDPNAICLKEIPIEKLREIRDVVNQAVISSKESPK